MRHAEKATDDPRDPSLSDQGEKRAAALMEALSDIAIGAVFTTQYRRTRQTVEGVAESHGIEVQPLPIEASNAATYAVDLENRIRENHSGKNVFVIGHSNTVPAIVRALSGVDIGEMGEDEYDRMYIVTGPLGTSRQAQLIRTRYGDPAGTD